MFTSACDWKPPRHADPLPAPCRAGKPLRRPVADAVAGGNGLCMDIGRKRSAAFDSSAREPDRRPPTGAVIVKAETRQKKTNTDARSAPRDSRPGPLWPGPPPG